MYHIYVMCGHDAVQYINFRVPRQTLRACERPHSDFVALNVHFIDIGCAQKIHATSIHLVKKASEWEMQLFSFTRFEIQENQHYVVWLKRKHGSRQ